MMALTHTLRRLCAASLSVALSLCAAAAEVPASPVAPAAPAAPAAPKTEVGYLKGAAQPQVQAGWRLYIDKGDAPGAQRLFQAAFEQGPRTFLTGSSLSQMLMQQARFAEAAAVLVKTVQSAPWDEYAEPALRDLESLLPYLPAKGVAGAATPAKAASATSPATALPAIGRDGVRAALQERLAGPQLGWIERALLRELLNEVLQLDGDEAAQAAQAALRQSQRRVGAWRLIGPFSNRNREGFSVAHDLETTAGAPDFSKRWSGRGREVGWFAQETPASGLLFFDRIVYPGSESLVFACVFVESAEAMPATLAVAAAGASALWLNGRTVYSDGVYCYNDGSLQRLIGVNLNKGLNCLLFKVAGDLKCNAALGLAVIPLAAQELDKPGSAARADERAGLLQYRTEPVAAAAPTTAAASAALEAAGAAGAGNASVAAESGLELGRVQLRQASGNPGVFWGALGTCALRAKDGDPLALMNVAYLMRERGLSDVDYARERVYNEEIAKRYPACPLFVASAAGNQPDENRRRTLLRQALQAGPQERGVADDLLRLTLKGGFYDEAWQQGQQLLNQRPTHAVLQALATVAQSRDWSPEAEGLLRQALAYMPSSGGLLTRAARALPTDEARETLLRESGCGEPSVQAALAGLRYKARDYERAGQDYLRLARRVAYDSAYWDAAAAARVALGDYAGAAEAVREGLKWMPQSPALLEKTGRLLLCAGKDVEGRAFFAKALEVKRDNPQLQAYLTQLLPQEQAFYSRADIPFSELKGRDLQSKDHPDFDSVILLDQGFIRVNRNGTSRKMYRSVVKVLRPAAADDVSQMQIFYNPGSQRATVVRARVWRPDGSFADNAQISDDDYGEDGGASLMYGSGGRVRRISLPDVKVGSMVDFQWTVEDSGEQLYHNEFCDNFFFGSVEPAVRFRYTVEYPEDMPLKFAVANASYQPVKSAENGVARLEWNEKDIPGMRMEPDMPPYAEVKAQLGVSTFRDWDALGMWAWNLFQPQMELTPEMKQKVAELTAQAKTREEKIRAIYDFVVDEIRYVSISFGRFGYVPHKVERTFRSRYGDCKDTAILFVAMLQEAGVEARPVLVRTRDLGAERLGLPSSEGYNHSIAYVPAGAPGEKHYWLDGTVDYHAFGVIPFMDRGTKALVFGPGKGELIEIDPAAPEQNVEEASFDVTLQTGGEGEARVRSVERGEGVVGYMQYLEKPESLKYILSTIVQERYPGATVADVVSSAPGKVEEASFSFRVVSQQLAARGAGEFRLKTAFFPLDLSRMTALPQRQYDLVIGQPRIVRKSARVVLPAGARWRTVPGNLELKIPAAAFVRKVETKDGVLTMQTELILRAERIKPAEYVEFKRFCNAVSAAMEEAVTYADPAAPAAGQTPAAGGGSAAKPSRSAGQRTATEAVAPVVPVAGAAQQASGKEKP